MGAAENFIKALVNLGIGLPGKRRVHLQQRHVSHYSSNSAGGQNQKTLNVNKLTPTPSVVFQNINKQACGHRIQFWMLLSIIHAPNQGFCARVCLYL